jgi:hypothetical protein
MTVFGTGVVYRRVIVTVAMGLGWFTTVSFLAGNRLYGTGMIYSSLYETGVFYNSLCISMGLGGL